MVDFLKVVGLSLLSLLALFLLTKLLGNRQMSQLTLFDYIAGISIGSIAGEVATHPGEDSWLGIIALAVYGGVTLVINLANERSLRFRRFILGTPLVLFSQGKLYMANLKKARLDLSEFLTECRNNGYFDLAQLSMVVLEVNGRLSFLPLEIARPLTPADMGQFPPQQDPPLPVVMDGQVLGDALSSLGVSQAHLQKALKQQGFNGPGEVFLGMADKEGHVCLYEKIVEPPSKTLLS